MLLAVRIVVADAVDNDANGTSTVEIGLFIVNLKLFNTHRAR